MDQQQLIDRLREWWAEPGWLTSTDPDKADLLAAAVAEVERLREENEELRIGRRRWRDAGREQPEDGAIVFCTDLGQREVFVANYTCGAWWDVVNACETTVTHWQPMPGLVGTQQPLPAPPAKEE